MSHKSGNTQCLCFWPGLVQLGSGFSSKVHACMCVNTQTLVPVSKCRCVQYHTCGGRRMTFGSPPSVLVLGIKLGSAGLVAWALTWWAILFPKGVSFNSLLTCWFIDYEQFYCSKMVPMILNLHLTAVPMVSDSAVLLPLTQPIPRTYFKWSWFVGSFKYAIYSTFDIVYLDFWGNTFFLFNL